MPVFRNLLIYANVCGAPCLFMALVLLFNGSRCRRAATQWR